MCVGSIIIAWNELSFTLDLASALFPPKVNCLTFRKWTSPEKRSESNVGSYSSSPERGAESGLLQAATTIIAEIAKKRKEARFVKAGRGLYAFNKNLPEQ